MPWRWILPAIQVLLAAILLVSAGPAPSSWSIVYNIDLPATVVASPLIWGGDEHWLLHEIVFVAATGCFWFWFGWRIELRMAGRNAPPPGWAATVFFALITPLCWLCGLIMLPFCLVGLTRWSDFLLIVWLAAGCVFFPLRVRDGWRARGIRHS